MGRSCEIALFECQYPQAAIGWERAFLATVAFTGKSHSEYHCADACRCLSPFFVNSAASSGESSNI
jgi:hypothetical protein